MNFTTKPLKIIFYEKPGCSGNKKQKELLEQNKISFDTKSILDTPWDITTLNQFFQGLEKEQIINQFAPQIKNNEIDIKKLTKGQLISMMIEQPILIKRPLLEIGNHKICGFDIDKINKLLKASISSSNEISTCQSETPCKSV